MKNKNIEKLLKENVSYRNVRKIANELKEKWNPTGLLDELDGIEQNNMAILLENQAKQLIRESTTTSTTAEHEEWSGVALPLVRKVFGNIAAKQFLSVQPMSQPTGIVFFIDYLYGTSKTGYTAASGTGNDYIMGDTSTANAPRGGLYGAGRYAYSMNNESVPSGTVTTGSVTWADVDFNDDMSASVSAETLQKITFPITSSWNIDTEGIRAFTITASADSEIEEVYQAYTSISGGNITFITSGSFPVTKEAALIYHKQPKDYNRGVFEDKTGTNLNIPEIEFELTQKSIVAKPRKLKAVWTPEIQQDLAQYQSIDAEVELTNMLFEHVSMEIDAELLDMLMINAPTTHYWSAEPGYEINTAKTAFEKNTSYYISNKADWYQTLLIKIQKASNNIHAKTMRGGANFLVVSPTVATVLESIPGFNTQTDGNQEQFAMGVEKVGKLTNRWTVYKNPYMKENVILLGFKGPSFLETGAVYAPFIPLIMSPLVMDADNFTPRKMVSTRYAKTMTRDEFYSKIVIGGLNTV